MMDSELAINGYTLYRKNLDQIKMNRGGGVMLYVSEKVTSMISTELNDNICESIWVNLKLKGNLFLNFGVCYRTDSTTQLELENMFTIIRKATKHATVIVGDFNYPKIDWNILECSETEEPFLDLIQDCFLTQHVINATRGNNILDLVFTTEKSMVDSIEVIEHFAKSDHEIVIFDLVAETDIKELIQYKYCFYRAKYNEIRKKL